jgi:hypothetical protein
MHDDYLAKLPTGVLDQLENTGPRRRDKTDELNTPCDFAYWSMGMGKFRKIVVRSHTMLLLLRSRR